MVKYRSKFEAKLAKTKYLKGAKYEPYSLPYTIEANYYPDWELPNGLLVEAKGRFTWQDKKKMLAVVASNPESSIVLLFSGKPHWKQGQQNVKWCEKHGFNYLFEGDIV